VHEHNDRKDLRHRYPVWVRLRCERCKRTLGECYGDTASTLLWVWSASGVVSGAAFSEASELWVRQVTGARALSCRCRCGANYPIRGGKLAAAFRTKAAQPAQRDREIWLPTDLGR
jgi:hypothetical protein